MLRRSHALLKICALHLFFPGYALAQDAAASSPSAGDHPSESATEESSAAEAPPEAKTTVEEGAPSEPGDEIPSASAGERADEDAGEGGETPAAGSMPAATASPSSESSVEPYAEARSRVARGEQLFQDGNYDAALTEFSRAYETMAGHPARYLVLYNMGQCYEKLYRYDDAIDAYQKYLDQGGTTAEDAATVKAKMELLENLLGTLRLSVVDAEGKAVTGYEVWIDGRHVADGADTVSVPSGNHEVEIRAAGYESGKKQVQLPARAERALNFELAPLAEEYRGLPQAVFWTTAGLTVASAVAGTVFGVMARSERSNVDAQLDAGPPQSLMVTEDDRDSIQDLTTTADAFFIGAGVLGVSTVVLGFMTDFGGPSASDEMKPEAGASEGAAVDAWSLPGGGVLGIRGAF